MKRSRKIIALTLAGVMGWQSAEPQAWAESRTPNAHSTYAALFDQQTLMGRFVSGYTGPRPSIQVRQEATARLHLTRRQLIVGTAAAVAMSGLTGETYAQTPPPSISDAQQHRYLLERFLNSSYEFQESLHAIRAAELNLQAQAARNVSVTTSQSDLTHAPRLPLGRSSATPGPLNPALKDVIGRASEQIEGPIRQWESLETKQPTFWKQLLDRVETLALRGGYTRNSNSKVTLSWQGYYLAAIDAEDAATKPFEIVDARWQDLEAKWFDLALIDIELRRIASVKRFKEKKRAEARDLMDIHQVADPLAKQSDILRLDSEIDALQRDLLAQEGAQRTLASDIVVHYLRGSDADKSAAATADTYRPLPPQIQPSLGLVQRILLGTDHPLDRVTVRAFRSALRDRLHLSDSDIPADPLDPRSRRLILDQVWKIAGHDVAIPMTDATRDAYYPVSLNHADELLAQPQTDLLLRTPPAPQQAALFVKIKRSFQLVKIYKLQELRQWSFNLFIKLGLDLPIQFSSQNVQPIDHARNDLLISKEEELRRAVDALLAQSQDSTDASVKQARTDLETARTQLRQAAREIADWLGKIPTQIPYGNRFVNDWEDPAFDLELRIALLERRMLEIEKAYRRLDYLVEGRKALRRTLDDKRDAFLAAPAPERAAPSTVAPIERKNLALPGKLAGRAGLLGLASSLLGFGAEMGHPLLHTPGAPVGIEILLSAGLLIWTLFLPQILNHRFKSRSDRLIRFISLLSVAQIVVFPWGPWLGLLVAAITAALAWRLRPESLIVRRPFSTTYNTAFTMDRREFLKQWAYKFVVGAVATYLLFPFYEFVKDFVGVFIQRLTGRTAGSKAIGIKPVRLPLAYTPVESGELVHVQPPTGDTLTLPYLVRWIGPGERIPTDAHFVFQALPGAGAAEDRIVTATNDLRNAEDKLQTARQRGTQDAQRAAQTDVAVAQSRLTAARSGRVVRDEPLPRNAAIQIDRTWPLPTAGTPVHAGEPLLLAVQKSARSAQLQLTLSPEETAAIGRGLGHPEQGIMMWFERSDGGPRIGIPAAAIEQLDRSAEGESGLSALVRDPAKGGFRQIKLDASILLSDALIQQGANIVPPETLKFFADMSRDQAGKIPSLELVAFSEWKNGQHVPFEEKLEPNEIVGLAELQASPAGAPQVSAPQQSAAVDVSTFREQKTVYERSLTDLRAEINRLPASAAGDARRIDIAARITGIESQIQNLNDQMGHVGTAVRITTEEGLRIGPREVELVDGRRWVFARYRVARRLNAWTQRHTTAALPAAHLPRGVLNWDPQALDQVDTQATITVRSALGTHLQADLKYWNIVFPSTTETQVYNQSFELTLNDPVLDLSRLALRKSYSIAEARRLMPRPGSVLPVRLQLPYTVALKEAPRSSESDTRNLLNFGSSLFGVGALVVLYRAARIRLRLRQTQPARGLRAAQPTDYLPSYLEAGKPNEFFLEKMDAKKLGQLTFFFKNTFLPYEHRDRFGRELTEADIQDLLFGHTGLSAKDSAILVNYFYFSKNKEKANQKITHVKWIVTTAIMMITLMLVSDASFQVIRTAFLLGNLSWDILASRTDWTRIFQWHTVFTDPVSLLDGVIPPMILSALVLLVIYSIGKMIAETIPPMTAVLREFWFRRWYKVHEIRRNFLRITAEISPHGTGIRPTEAIRRIRKDDAGLDDTERALELHNPEEFMDLLRRFGRLITERAAAHLSQTGNPYIYELRDNLESFCTGQSLFTEARRHASDARWVATVLRETARYQGTAQALIPAGTPLDLDRLQFDPAWLELIAERKLGMDMPRIQALVGAQPLPGDEAQRRIERIRQEFLDRALVYWAIHEMRKRPITSFVALDTFDLNGLAFLNSGRARADKEFNDLRGDIEEALDEFHLRQPTLLPRAHPRRAEYSRQTRMFQLIRYLHTGFGKDNRLNPDHQRLVRDLLVDPKSGKSLIRDRSEQDIPTFESLAFEYYLTGIWPQSIADELETAYRTRLGYAPEKAAEKVAKIKKTLDRENTRLFMAWAVARRMMKDAPENFDLLLQTLRSTINREATDTRYLSDRAPLMDFEKNNEPTNADLLIADLTHGNLLEELLDITQGPLLGDIDLFEDPALEINLREAAIDLGLMTRVVSGHVHLTALSSELDAFIDEMNSRITSRLPEAKYRRVHIFSWRQSEDLLRRAGQHRNNSLFEVSVEPANFARVVDPDLTDERIFIMAPPNPYLKYSALLLFVQKVSPEWAAIRQAMTKEQGEQIDARLNAIEDQLTRMNVRVKIYETWDEAILNHDVPSEDDDHSYNTIVIIYPKARRLKSIPTTQERTPVDQTTLVLTDELPRDAARLLSRTWWGKGGKGAIYKVLRGVTFSNLPKGFYALRDNLGRLLALRYFHRQTLRVGPIETPAIYHSWTTDPEQVRGQGVITNLSKRTLDAFTETLANKGIVVCNIENDNTRSRKNIEKRGYVPVGEFVSAYTATHNPQDDAHVRPAIEADKSRILALLEHSYKDYALTDFNPSEFDVTDGHYVWEENGQILAVLNAKKQHWTFRQLKSYLPSVVTRALAYIPYLRVTFNLHDLYFLKLGNVAFADGQADKIPKTIDALMNRNQVHSAWGFFDAKGPVYADLKKVNTFGPTGLLNAVQETNVRTYAYALDEGGRQLLREIQKRRLFIPYRNLAWWLAPFILLGGLLGIPTSTQAAPLLPSVLPTAHQTAEAIAQYVVQPGDSWWSISHHVLKAGARFTDVIAANPDHKLMLHPGDLLTIPGLHAPTPVAAPIVNMVTLPLEQWQVWILHPTPEMIALGLLAVIGLSLSAFWLWNTRGRWSRLVLQPAFGILATVGLIAQTGLSPTPPPHVDRTPIVETVAAPVRRESPTPPAPVALPDVQPTVAPDLQVPAEPLPLPFASKAAQPWIEYRDDRLRDAAALHADIRSGTTNTGITAVEQLRQEYLALTAHRQAERVTTKPRRVVRMAKTLWHKIRPAHAAEPRVDPELDALKSRAIDLIKAAKRNTVITQEDAQPIHDALIQEQAIPNQPEDQRFERVFGSLWDSVKAGPSTLAQELATIAQNAAETPMTVEGTEHLKSDQKRLLLQQRAADAQRQALTDAVAHGVIEGSVDQELALSNHLRFLGLDVEADAMERAALKEAHDAALMPQGKPLFREPQDRVRVLHPEHAKAQHPELWTLLEPVISRAEEAAKQVDAAVQDSVTRESAWQWKQKLARDVDLAILFPEERAALKRALDQELLLRSALKAEERAIFAVLQAHVGAFSFDREAIQTPVTQDPDDAQLDQYEREIGARHQTLSVLNTVQGRHADVLHQFWMTLPRPVEEWNDMATLVRQEQAAEPPVANTRGARAERWLTVARRVETHLERTAQTPAPTPTATLTPEVAPVITTAPAQPVPQPQPFWDLLQNALLLFGSVVAFGAAMIFLKTTKRAGRGNTLAGFFIPFLLSVSSLLHRGSAPTLSTLRQSA